MGRRRKIDRPRPLEIQLPESIRSKVDAELYSELEGRIPFGAYSRLSEQLFTEWLEKRGVVV
jgi:hypothetical protein